MSDLRQAAHDETIEPINPGFSRARPAAEKPAKALPKQRKPLWPVFGGIALVAGLLGVFVALPRWFSGTGQESVLVEQPDSNQASGAIEAALSAEERARLQVQAQRVLASLLTQQNGIEQLGPDEWGGDDWSRYLELSRRGDDAYLEEDFAAALAAYTDALAIGESLIDLGAARVERALTAGVSAIEAGDAEEALRQFNIALRVDAENAAALAGKSRAQNLPAVLELVREGRAQDDAGNLPAAIDAYRQALEIDSQWRPAREALTVASGNLQQYQFSQLLSRGYAALGERDYGAAAGHFNAALAMRPDSSEAREGLFQAEEGVKQGQIALAEVRALAFERRELWAQAIEQYSAALATDPTLDYALTGLERARARQDLDAKLVNLIENPRLLFDDAILAEAGSLLQQAAAVTDPGQRIQQQIESLQRLVGLASTPQRVVIESDALTQITVYRVGTLGAFLSTELELRPGDYTAVGSRNGYRDVRTSFTVLPGRQLDPIRIVCVEPI